MFVKKNIDGQQLHLIKTYLEALHSVQHCKQVHCGLAMQVTASWLQSFQVLMDRLSSIFKQRTLNNRDFTQLQKPSRCVPITAR